MVWTFCHLGNHRKPEFPYKGCDTKLSGLCRENVGGSRGSEVQPHARPASPVLPKYEKRSTKLRYWTRMNSEPFCSIVAINTFFKEMPYCCTVSMVIVDVIYTKYFFFTTWLLVTQKEIIHDILCYNWNLKTFDFEKSSRTITWILFFLLFNLNISRPQYSLQPANDDRPYTSLRISPEPGSWWWVWM